MPPKFFVTHSWHDIDFAKRLCNDLHAHGLDGFFDERSIKPGESLPSRIARGLEDCDIYIPILSPASLQSTWCDWELDIAITLNRDSSRNGRPQIMPVIALKCSVPTRLRHLLYVDFASRAYDEALNDLLTKGFGVQPLSPPTNFNHVPADVSEVPFFSVTIPLSSRLAAPPPPKIETYLPTKTGNDGKEMILIPAGEFLMGSDERDDEDPPHEVYLDAFYISRYPVTHAEYKKFVDATRREVPKYWRDGIIPPGKKNHPVVNVSWDDAAAYCKWAGVRLPTEAEWEKAASWDDANEVKRRYPWGDEFDTGKCNTGESELHDTTPVGTYSPRGDSAYGVSDMVGNVLEWCADWDDENYYKNSPAQNPQGPSSGKYRILRGGSWYGYFGVYARCTSRSSSVPDLRFNHVGFRVAMSVTSEDRID